MNYGEVEEWHQHTPGDIPVHPETVVEVIMWNDDKLAPMPAGDIDWYFPGDQVKFYRIIHPKGHDAK